MPADNTNTRSLAAYSVSSTDENQHPASRGSPEQSIDTRGTRQASSQAGNDDIGTPEALIKLLHDALETKRFALDPASGAQPIQIGKTEFDKSDNGLRTSWAVSGSSVYLNPPYSNPEPWLNRLTHFVQPDDEKKLDFGVALLKADPSTHWFQTFICESTVLAFPDRRLAFYNPETGEQMETPPWPVVIALFGDPPQAIPESLSTGCETGLFDSCAIFTSVEATHIDGQQTLTELLSDGGVSVQEAVSDSPYWAQKPVEGYSADTTWYLNSSRADAIHSPQTATRSR